jgi:methionyl-tRNA synthetase
LAVNAPETADAEFTWKEFQIRCNSDLVGKFGNLINRTLSFIQNRCDKSAPDISTLQEIDKQFLADVQTLTERAAENYASYRLRQVCQTIMELAQRGNVYVDAKKPWAAAKQPETRPAMETTIACCLRCIQALAVIASPIMPETAEKIWRMLGFEQSLESMGWEAALAAPMSAGRELPAPEVLFRPVDDAQIAAEIAKLRGSLGPKGRLCL